MFASDPLIESDIATYLDHRVQNDLVRFITCGSVDDGKSTLIGRLLHDSQLIADDHLETLKTDSQHRTGNDGIDLSLVTDGLKAEREQGITIDVAYQYFSTRHRNFIIADTPGHEQYTRNMATGASTADLAVILIDARKGVVQQTRRHSYLAVLLGVKHVVIAVNKMDLVDYSEQRYLEIVAEYTEYSANLSIESLEYLPISALHGDNVVESSEMTPWFVGPTLIDYLNAVEVAEPTNTNGFRLPVQLVLRANADFRGYAGSITSGQIHRGDRVTALPSGVSSTVQRIVTFDGDLDMASAGDAIALTLGDEIDMSRGDLLVKEGENVEFDTSVEATIIWMADKPLDPGEQLILQSHNGTANVTVDTVRYLLDVNTGQKEKATALQLNEIGDCLISADRKLLFESYESNRAGGSFILINRISNSTVAAGMISGPLSPWDQPPKASLEAQVSEIGALERQLRYRQRPCTVLLTGLTGAGKSSIATALERCLFDRGNSTVRLDGENVRLGISKDLGFTAVDRSENLRRVAEIARLINGQGLIAIAALLAPQAEARARAQQLLGADKWVEVFLDTPLSVCRSRDTTGLYEAADRGDIEEFPGVSATYDAPEDADLRIDTSDMTVDRCVEVIVAFLIEKGFIHE